jgi:hypothetical protein
MAQLIKTTTTYHPNLDFTDEDTVEIKPFPSEDDALKAGKEDYEKFITNDGDTDPLDFDGEHYGFGKLEKSPNAAYANDEGEGIACHWYVVP